MSRLLRACGFPALILAVCWMAALPAPAQTSAGLTAQIVSSTDGSPMANALVTLTRLDIPATYRIKTDKNGKFSYFTLPVGVFAITVTCPDGNIYHLQRRIRTSPVSIVEATFRFKVPAAANSTRAAGTQPEK